MNKTLSLLTSGSTSHMFGKLHRENGGVRRGKRRPIVKIGLQGEKRRGVVWAHVGAGGTASGQTPCISSIVEIGTMTGAKTRHDEGLRVLYTLHDGKCVV